MERKQSKAIYLGQILTIMAVELIMLLVKIVQPFDWVQGVFPSEYIDFMQNLQYTAIEFALVVVIICHLIFGKSFQKMGLKKPKRHMAVLGINTGFLILAVGMAFFAAQMSREITFNGIRIFLDIINNFVFAAFINEIIFRGFLLEAFENLFGGKKVVSMIVASILTGGLFALTFLPDIIIQLTTVSNQTLMIGLLIPFVMGIYLGALYYYTDDLWVCMAAHGMLLSIASLPLDFMKNIFYAVYTVVLLIHLTYCIVRFYHPQDEEIMDESGEEEQETEEINDGFNVQKQDREWTRQSVTDGTRQSEREEKVDIPYFEKKGQENEASDIQDQEELGKTKKFTEGSLQDLERTTTVPVLVENKKTKQPESMEDTVSISEMEDTITIQDVLGDTTPLEDLGDTVSLEDLSDTTPLEDLEEQDEPADENENLRTSKVIPFNLRDGSKKADQPPVKTAKDRQVQNRLHPEPNYIAHLEKYLGEFERIYKQMTPTDPPIDIMFFKGEKYNALVTNGMRSIPMKVPHELGDYKLLELMMFLDKSIEITNETIANEENAWLVKLLIDLALFPKETGGYLSVGHIVGNGENLEPYSRESGYCGALIFSPMEQENVRFCRYVEKGNTIYLYNVMPLYKDELRFVQEHSSDQFINLMSELGVRQVIKRNRIDVIKEMKKEIES